MTPDIPPPRPAAGGLRGPEPVAAAVAAATVLRRARPGADHRSGRRRPLRHLDLLGGGRGLRVRVRSGPRCSRFPLMAAVQLMCARLGMVSGRGLASVIRRRYSRWVLWGACALLIVANVINIGADLGGMAEATEMVTGVPAVVWTPLYAGSSCRLLFWSSYRADRAHLQVAHARAVRLRAGRLPRPPRLGGGAAGHLLSRTRVVQRLPRGLRRHPGHHASRPISSSGRPPRRWRRIARPGGAPCGSAAARPTRSCRARAPT